MHDGIAEDKMKIKIPPKRGVTTPLRSKPSHVTLKANEKLPHSLLCRIRKYASAPWSFDVDDALAGTPLQALGHFIFDVRTNVHHNHLEEKVSVHKYPCQFLLRVNSETASKVTETYIFMYFE
ncbi:hypothetical protein AVEN_160352-1 [Araneus ventricosus]|uniref:Uncharacterized protein n=1 Tax=Araneus ventricosus TaxID=182803 RepID=A0A4Y2UMX4_ARAVE|nr:hypothetical protein AVEN_160352-1 [Araneus ventricosus]